VAEHEVRWVVLTADIIGSRRVAPRESLRDNLVQALVHINNTWAHDIVVPFSLLAGDEIQGVVRPGPFAFCMPRRLRWAMRRLAVKPPILLRVGVGWGFIETPLSASRSWEMDGPAFHYARAALRAAKAARSEATRFACGDPLHERWANIVLALTDALMGQWTRAQWEAVDAYERRGTYASAAKELGIALQNVQKRCSAAHWSVVYEAERWLGESLASPSSG